jgi:hypothetical protein
VIEELGLHHDQYTILKHDLHYSHKDPEVLQLLADHNIIPIYVPAGCTDVIQECDTVINAPFKKVIRACFRDHLYAEFELYKTECIAAEKSYMDWSPKLKMGDLKPLITGWVQTAMTHLAGAGMKASIVKAFKNDGCMEEIRSPRRRLAYLEDAAEELQRRIDLVMTGREEENTHEIALSGDLNELVEADDGIEVVNDDDVNSEDESDDDDNDDRSV